MFDRDFVKWAEDDFKKRNKKTFFISKADNSGYDTGVTFQCPNCNSSDDYVVARKAPIVSQTAKCDICNKSYIVNFFNFYTN